MLQHPIEFIAPLAFKAADKFFKFVSWAIIIVALRYARKNTESSSLEVVGILSESIYVLALLSQVFYLAVRTPKSLGVPDQWADFSKVIQFFVAVTFGALLTSPYLFLDQVLDGLMQLQIKTK